jgi:hypothetical protein
MSELGKLVAVRSLDEVVVKGWTFDFRPNRDFFHVEEEGGDEPVRVSIEDLKAVFFIKTLGRDPNCVDKRSFGNRVGPEERIWIEFTDGEKLAGWSNSFRSLKRGFFVFPADPDSNMEKAYVFRSAIARMEEGEAAEEAARAFNASSQEPPPSEPSSPESSSSEPSSSESSSPGWDLEISPEDYPGTYRLARKGHRRPGEESNDR